MGYVEESQSEAKSERTQAQQGRLMCQEFIYVWWPYIFAVATIVGALAHSDSADPPLLTCT